MDSDGLEDYDIVSKRFRNKKTGEIRTVEIRTVIPVLEMNDYEEVD